MSRAEYAGTLAASLDLRPWPRAIESMPASYFAARSMRSNAPVM